MDLRWFSRGTSRHGPMRSRDGSAVAWSGGWEERQQQPVVRDGPSICERGWSGGCIVTASCQSGWSGGRTDALLEVPVCTLILSLGGSLLCPILKGVHLLWYRALESGRCTNAGLILYFFFCFICMHIPEFCEPWFKCCHVCHCVLYNYSIEAPLQPSLFIKLMQETN